MRKVSEQNVVNNNNPQKLQPLARLQETNTLPWIFRADLSKLRYRKLLLLIRYAMHDFHFPHLNTLSSIQRQAYILDVLVRCTTSETFYSVKISVARATQLRRLIVGIAGLLQCTHLLALISRQTPLPYVFAPAGPEPRNPRRHPNVPRVKKKYRITVSICETFPIWWN